MTKQKKISQAEAEALLRQHKLHLGLYAGVTIKLGTDPSYVSRVVNGKRKSDRVQAAVIQELRRIEGK